MNKVTPLSILTCDCCTSTGLIRKCRLKNCDYKMCLKCSSKYYIEGQNFKCPACRRNINNGSNCFFFLPTYLQVISKFIYKIFKKIHLSIRNQIYILNYKTYWSYLCRFIGLLFILAYIFGVLCIFRYVYHLHCGLFILGSCNDDFISEMFIIYVIIGMFISFLYFCVMGCLYTCFCGNNDDADFY